MLESARPKKPKKSLLEKISKNENSIKNLWLSLCLIGNLWQAVQVCINYFSYDIVTTVSITFPSTFIAPAMTTCFYVVNMVVWHRAELRWPDIRDRMDMKNYSSDAFVKQ